MKFQHTYLQELNSFASDRTEISCHTVSVINSEVPENIPITD